MVATRRAEAEAEAETGMDVESEHEEDADDPRPPPVFEEMSDVDSDGHADDEDEDDEDQTAERGARKRKRVGAGAAKAVVGEGKGRKSKPHKDCQNPARAAQRRAQGVVSKIMYELSLRPDIRADCLNRVMLNLDQQERADLRALHAIQQEHYIAKRDCVEFLERDCFNALNSVDLRACEALSTRLMDRLRERLACDEHGKRRVICRPPQYTGIGNPLTQKSNREQGILWEHKAVLVPYIFRNSQQMKKAADLVLEGRTLHLAFDYSTRRATCCGSWSTTATFSCCRRASHARCRSSSTAMGGRRGQERCASSCAARTPSAITTRLATHGIRFSHSAPTSTHTSSGC